MYVMDAITLLASSEIRLDLHFHRITKKKSFQTHAKGAAAVPFKF